MKLKSLFLISMLFVIALSLDVSAAGSLRLITTTWGANTIVNLTTKADNDASQLNMTNISIFFNATNTANITSSFIVNISNSTATDFDAGYANFTFGNDIVLEDTAVGGIVLISFGVGDSNNIRNASSNINIARTTPTVPTGLIPTGTQSNNTLDIVSTVTGTDTTACTLEFIGYIPNGAVISNAMTHSGNLCTARYTSVSDATYQYRIRASDGTDVSIYTSSQFITVGSDEPNLQALGALKQIEVKQQQQQQKKSNNNNIFFLIMGVIAVYAIMSNKKK